ncbi:MAG: DNA primase [Minisyncoccia bacterium]
MNSSVAKIKDRLNIEEVVSSYIKLEKAGANLKARCPFHNEKTPSFFVSPERGSYYCFGCGASGDIFTFVEEFEGLDFKGALKLLADRAGVTLEVYSREQKEVKEEIQNEKERLYEVMEEATKYFENNLQNNKEALEYLKSRGLNEKSIKDFRIGFAILDWRKLYDYLKAKNLPAGRQGFTDVEIEKAGLAKRPEDKTKAMYDRFRGRIMFPINDSSGRAIAFSGRLLEVGLSAEALAKAGAKYLNSPEMPIFSKHAVLYGIDKAKDSIRKNNFSILVEGQMDLILSHQAGYKNTVATSGTALSDATMSKENVVSNLGLIRRLSENLVLAFDADKAGASATIRAGKIALSLGMDVKVVEMPEGIDPADLISGNGLPEGPQGADAWREAIRNSKHLIEFLLNKILKNCKNDTRKAGKEIKEKILPFVDALSSSIEKNYFLKKISDQSGIPENALQDDLRKIEQELKYVPTLSDNSVGGVGIPTESVGKKTYIERKLLGIALWKKNKELEKSLGQILEKYKDSGNDLIFEAEVFYGNSENLEKDIGELLANLEEEKINEELLRKMQELRITKNKDIEKELLLAIQNLNKQKHEKKK